MFRCSWVFEGFRRSRSIAAVLCAFAASIGVAGAADDARIVIPFAEGPCEPGGLAGVVSLKSRTSLGDRVQACIVHSRSDMVVVARVLGLSAIAGGSRTDDSGFGDSDFVGVALDPDGTGADVYYFLTTPQGTRYEIASRSTRFRARWTSEVTVGQGTWTAVMRIPLASFGWHDGFERRLRINLVGQYVDRGERYTLAYDPSMEDAVPPAWPVFGDSRFWRSAAVTGPVAAQHRTSAAVNLFGLESAGADHQQYATPDGTVVTRRTRTAGVDATAVYGEAAKLVMTVAPDFSNVDADQLTVLPQEFRRTYTEYRPFFVEDAAVFTPPVDTSPLLGNQVFYSPQFESVDAGYKLTAKTGGYRVGLLSFHGSSLDESAASGATIVSLRHTDPQQSTTWWALHGAAAQDGVFDSVSTIGAATHSGPMQYALQWSSSAGAHDGRSLTGTADYRRDDNRLNLSYAAISPDYDPVMGYTAVADVRGAGTYALLRFAPRARRRWSITASTRRPIASSTGSAPRAWPTRPSTASCGFAICRSACGPGPTSRSSTRCFTTRTPCKPTGGRAARTRSRSSTTGDRRAAPQTYTGRSSIGRSRSAGHVSRSATRWCTGRRRIRPG